MWFDRCGAVVQDCNSALLDAIQLHVLCHCNKHLHQDLQRPLHFFLQFTWSINRFKSPIRMKMLHVNTSIGIKMPKSNEIVICLKGVG